MVVGHYVGLHVDNSYKIISNGNIFTWLIFDSELAHSYYISVFARQCLVPCVQPKFDRNEDRTGEICLD